MPLGFNAAVQMSKSGCELPPLPGTAQYWTGYFTQDSRGGNSGLPGNSASSSITFVNAGTLTSSDSRFTGYWGNNGCTSGEAVNSVGCWYFDAGAGNTDRPTGGSNTQAYHETRGGGMWIEIIRDQGQAIQVCDKQVARSLLVVHVRKHSQ